MFRFVRFIGLVVLSAAFVLLPAESVQADTITFSNITSGSLSSEVMTLSGGWRWRSMYGNGHMHQGTGNPSPGLYIHTSCCSTPYRMDRTDGQPFSLNSMWGSGGASGTITSSGGGSQSLHSGTNTFSGSQWTNVTWIEWIAGGGDIDNVVVNSCGGAPSVSAGGPYSVNEGGSVSVSASGSSISSWAWDLDGNGSYETGGQSVTFNSGSYDGPGSRSIAVQGTNNCGSGTSSATVNISNVAPTINSVSAPNGLEGSVVSFSASASDPGPDTLSYLWNFGDGNNGSGANTQHSYSGDGTYTVTLTVSDGDGGTATQSQTVSVSNGDPIISNLVGDASGSEGSTLSWTVLASDPGGDPLTYSWDFGDGSAPVVNGSLPVVNHAYVNEGSYTLQVTVSDGQGGSASSLMTVTVGNSAPLLSALTGDTSGNEGDTYSFSVSASDPGSGDVLSYSWNFGDGSAVVTTSHGSVSHVFADNGTFGVTVTVSDNASPPASDSTTLLVSVSNVAPNLTSVNAPSGDEGTALSYSASASDPGADTLVYTWAMGDGTTLTGASVTHSYGDEGTYSLSLTVNDGDGGTDTASATIQIANVSPTISSAVMPSGDEGQNLIFSAIATDPGNDTLVYSWDFGDGTTDTGALVTHVFADNGNFSVLLTVSDGDGGSDTNTGNVTITNVAPSIDTLVGPSNADEGEAVTFSATTTDPSSTDTANMSYTWSWGDGTSDSSGASPIHAFPDDGNFTVVLSVNDGTDTVTQSHSVVVANVAPEFISTPPATAQEGVVYSYLPVIDDPGDEVFTWSLASSAPPSMTMDPASGELSWTPDYADSLTGTFAVTLTVDDGDGASDVQTWTIEVTFLDADGDGLSDSWEVDNGLDPNDPGDSGADPDGDGLSNSQEYAAGQNPNSFDGPDAPVPLTPLTGEEAVEVTPDLITSNAVDPQGDVLLYEFEVWADANLTVVVSSSGWIAEDAVETFWKVDTPLAENGVYWWRTRAADPNVEGPWSDVQEFMVNISNEAPGAPVAVYPVEGQVVADVTPAMQWAAAVDVDQDELSYTVHIYDSDGETIVAEASELAIAEGEVNGSWDVDVALDEDTVYSWSVMATDEHGLEGPWSELESFLYTLDNGAPEGVALISPEDGSSTPERSPVLVASEGADPEGGALEYIFEVDSVDSFDGSDYATATVTGSGTGTVEWDLGEDGVELPQNAVAYARVSAVDEVGIASVPHTISFEVRGENDPPPVPELLSPVDGATEESVTPVLEAGNVIDPEGDLVFYDFIVATDPELSDVVAGGEGLGLLGGTGPAATDGATSWQVDSNLNGDLYWSARAVDEFGEASEWAAPFALKVEGGEPNVEVPEDVLGGGALEGCDCSMGSADGGLPVRALALLALFMVPITLRRRRR